MFLVMDRRLLRVLCEFLGVRGTGLFRFQVIDALLKVDHRLTQDANSLGKVLPSLQFLVGNIDSQVVDQHLKVVDLFLKGGHYRLHFYDACFSLYIA
jgi:hypothetical protein